MTGRGVYKERKSVLLIFCSMSDDFDFDDLLDDVLDEVLPTKQPSAVSVAPSTSYAMPSEIPSYPVFKYKELQNLPAEMGKEWEKIIEVDEAVMKLRKTKPLSHAYKNSKGSISDENLVNYFHHLMEQCVGRDDKGKAVIETMERDSALLDLFQKELIRQVRTSVSASDPDLASDRWADLKSLLSM